MKAKLSPRLPHQGTSKGNGGKPKRQFFVEQHRKQIDDYMLGQIKKNKKSIKHIKKDIEDLKAQMNHLKLQNKTQRYDTLTLQLNHLKKDKSGPKLDSTTKRNSKGRGEGCLHTTRKQFVASKQSSDTSRRSSRMGEGRSKYSSGKNSTLKSISCGKNDHSSKALLKLKIQNLKEKAHLIRQSAEEIQQQISRKIQKKIEQSHHNTASHHSDAHQRYQELMELLRTNKRIEESPTVNPPHDTRSQKSILSTNREANNLKNSAISYYIAEPKQTPKPTSSSQLPSETNLLESNKQIKQAPKLQFTRCLNVQVVGEARQEQFEQLLRGEVSGGDLSFDNGQEEEGQLKELQFEFDQLVRQQLLSNDAEEKEGLGKSIRALLTRIGQLRQELNQ